MTHTHTLTPPYRMALRSNCELIGSVFLPNADVQSIANPLLDMVEDADSGPGVQYLPSVIFSQARYVNAWDFQSSLTLIL